MRRQVVMWILPALGLAIAGCMRGGFLGEGPSSADLSFDTGADGGRQDAGRPVDLGATETTGDTEASDIRPGIVCPAGFLSVPALPGYVETDFCVMKYEAKAARTSDGAIFVWGCDNDSDPASGDLACTDASGDWHTALALSVAPAAVAGGRPWRRVSRAAAIEACKALGSNYDLITNDQWQAVARDIEGVGKNWQEGKVGGSSSGNGGSDANQLNHGHSDRAPDGPLAADADDHNACVGTGQAVEPGIDDSCPGGWHLEKRTHVLSRGGVIWDFAGNLWEWTKDDNSETYGDDAFLSQIDDATHPTSHSLSGGTTTTARNARDQFGPAGDYSSLDTGNHGGLGHAFLAIVGGAVIRGGGRWTARQYSGVFYVRLINGRGSAYPYLGFRCVFQH